MERIQGSNWVGIDGKNSFTDNPPGTRLTAAWLNGVQEEIANMIEMIGDGETLSSSDDTQLLSAINRRVPIKILSDYPATGYGRLYNANIALAGQYATIYIDTDDTLGYVVNLSNTISLRALNGNKITALAGRLTINAQFMAGNHNVFAKDSIVSFGENSIDTVKPIWWEGSTVEQLDAAWQSLPTTKGGIVDARHYRGAQTITDKLSMVTTDHITFLFGGATFTLSGTGTNPLPAHFLLQGEDIWMKGEGTKFAHAAGCDTTAIGFTHGTLRGGVEGFELDGNKINNVAGGNDTLESGIMVWNDSSDAAAPTEDARVVIRNNVIHDFNHYGIKLYGDYGGSDIINNVIYDIGENGDPNSTGDGLFLGKEVSRALVQGNHSYGNLLSGIHIIDVTDLADVTIQYNNKIVNNWCYNNSVHGIYAHEESSYGSQLLGGQEGLLIQGNHCYSNTQSGIKIQSVDNQGSIIGAVITDNLCYSNTKYGIQIASAGSAAENTRDVFISNNKVYNNTLDGITLGAAVYDTFIFGNQVYDNIVDGIKTAGIRTILEGNTSIDNGNDNYVDTGTDTIIDKKPKWNDINNLVSVSVASGVTDVASFLIPQYFYQKYKGFRFKVWGTMSGIAGAKLLIIQVGSTSVTMYNNAAATDWKVEGTVSFYDFTTQNVEWTLGTGTTFNNADPYAAVTNDMSAGTVAFAIRAQCLAADLVNKYFSLIELF